MSKESGSTHHINQKYLFFSYQRKGQLNESVLAQLQFWFWKLGKIDSASGIRAWSCTLICTLMSQTSKIELLWLMLVDSCLYFIEYACVMNYFKFDNFNRGLYRENLKKSSQKPIGQESWSLCGKTPQVV